MGGIGDNVFVIPVIRALRARYPNHYITLVVRPYVLGFRELMPDCIDLELPYAFGKSTMGRLFEPIKALRFVLENYLSFNTELALIPRWGWDSWGAVFIAFFSRAERRVTFSEQISSEKRVRNWLHDTFFTHLSFDADQKHESAHIRSLVQKHERIEVGPVAGSLYLPSRRLPPSSGERRVVIGPFAAIDRRTWPVERWPEVIKAVSGEDERLRFTIVGSHGDREAAMRIADANPRTDVQCGLSLAQLVNLLSEAELFVGMDSGIAHLAGAAGIPVVQICCHPLNGLPDHTNSPVRFAALATRTVILQPQPTSGCEDACESDKACCICNLSMAQIVDSITASMQTNQPSEAERFDTPGAALRL